MCILAKLRSGDDHAIQANPSKLNWVVGISSPSGALLHVIDLDATASDLLPILHTSKALTIFSIPTYMHKVIILVLRFKFILLLYIILAVLFSSFAFLLFPKSFRHN